MRRTLRLTFFVYFPNYVFSVVAMVDAKTWLGTILVEYYTIFGYSTVIHFAVGTSWCLWPRD